jgi:hypothetical protein
LLENHARVSFVVFVTGEYSVEIGDFGAEDGAVDDCEVVGGADIDFYYFVT